MCHAYSPNFFLASKYAMLSFTLHSCSHMFIDLTVVCVYVRLQLPPIRRPRHHSELQRMREWPASRNSRRDRWASRRTGTTTTCS
ncbi:hypothetical protein DAI22_06g250700 [Oryza sativa Japonica Group]|nr:hypothetical protein DAI22_06g250700 [Oryza sativa Japonica Group]